MRPSEKTASTDPGDVLRRSLEMLERSQANLERSLAIENTLSRLVEAQEQLRRMVVAFITRTDVPAASPSSTNGTDLTERGPSPLVKNEEGEEIERTDLPERDEEEVHITLTDELPRKDPAPSVKHENQIDRTELPTTSASPLVERDEEEEEISSVSSVSSEEDVDNLDDEGMIATESTSANVPEEDEEVRPGCLAAAEKSAVAEAQSSGEEVAERSDGDENEGGSMGSEEIECSSDEGAEDDDMMDIEDSIGSTPKGANSRKLSMWKCAVCGRTIRGQWKNRQYHIYSHEGLKFSCPVAGCSAKMGPTGLSRHLQLMHGTSRSSLPAKTKAQLQVELDRQNQLAVECEGKYFPPSSLVSSEETPTRREAEFACKKCGKFCVDPSLRRDHVGLHLNLKILCPLRDCEHAGRVQPIKEHLYKMHGKALSQLTKGERERFEALRKTFYEEVDAVMEEYFQEPLRTEDKSLSCKKCGRRVMDRHQRRDHVGIHLKARFPCPYRKCGYSGREATMALHLPKKHGKSLQTLTKKQRSILEDARRKFHEQVDAVMEEYFS